MPILGDADVEFEKSNLIIDVECPGSALTEPWAIMGPEAKHMLAWRERCLALPFDQLELDQVQGEDGLALQQVEAKAPETSAVGHQHAFGASRRNRDFVRDRLGAVERAGCGSGLGERNVGDWQGVGELCASRRIARPDRSEPAEPRIVERKDPVFLGFGREQLLQFAHFLRHGTGEVVRLGQSLLVQKISHGNPFITSVGGLSLTDRFHGATTGGAEAIQLLL